MDQALNQPGHVAQVRAYLEALQSRITAALEEIEGMWAG